MIFSATWGSGVVTKAQQKAAQWALGLWLGLIYSTLGVVRFVVDRLRAEGWLVITVASLFAMAFVTCAVLIVRSADRRALALLTLAVIGCGYALIIANMASPEERAHLLQYGVVGLLAYVSFSERYRPALLFTAAAGWLDEGIQALLPTRHYDLRDVGFNALAGALACASLWLVQRSSAASSIAAGKVSR